VIAEAKLSNDEHMGKLFYECKDYAVALCQGEAWKDKIDDLCQVCCGLVNHGCVGSICFHAWVL